MEQENDNDHAKDSNGEEENVNAPGQRRRPSGRRGSKQDDGHDGGGGNGDDDDESRAGVQASHSSLPQDREESSAETPNGIVGKDGHGSKMAAVVVVRGNERNGEKRHLRHPHRRPNCRSPGGAVAITAPTTTRMPVLPPELRRVTPPQKPQRHVKIVHHHHHLHRRHHNRRWHRRHRLRTRTMTMEKSRVDRWM